MSGMCTCVCILQYLQGLLYQEDSSSFCLVLAVPAVLSSSELPGLASLLVQHGEHCVESSKWKAKFSQPFASSLAPAE